MRSSFIYSLLISCSFVVNPCQIEAQEVITKFSNKVNGQVRAIAVDETNDLVYLGGHFTRAGNFASYGGVLNTTDGLVSGDLFPNREVYTSYPDGSGGYYIGGNFTKIGNEQRTYLAHIDASGALTDFAADLDLSERIRAMQVYNGVLYLGGAFTAFKTSRESGGVAIDLIESKNFDKQFPKINGTVYSSVPDGAGGLYIGGSFSHVGDKERGNLAHIGADGTVTDWNPSANNEVRAMAISGSKLYVGGRFSSIGGQTRSSLASIDLATGEATNWNPTVDPPGSYVYSLVISDGTVYVGGDFVFVDGQIREYLAAVDITSGSVTAWTPNASNVVFSMVQEGSSLYVGGGFTSIGGLPRSYLAEIDLTSGNPTAWNPSPNNVVRSLAVSGSSVYVGGNFTSIGGQVRNKLAEIDSSLGNASNWDPNLGSSGTVFSIKRIGDLIYVGGDFKNVGGLERNNIAALDAFSGSVSAWNPNANNDVNNLNTYGDDIFIGGSFRTISGEIRNRLMAIDLATENVIDWNPNSNAQVETLAITGSNVYVGGFFSKIGGQARNRIAAVDVTSGSPTSWDPDANDVVNSLEVSGTNVYAGGSFTSIGGQTRNRIAALDATAGLATPWNPNANNLVYKLTISGSTVYVGGVFSNIGGQARNNIAAIDLTSGSATSWNPNATGGRVYSMAISGGLMYVGGTFTNIGGQSRTRIAAVDISTGNVTPWSPEANSNVLTLSTSGSTVYAGGNFKILGGQDRNNAAAFDLQTGELTSWNPNADDGIFTLDVSGGVVYAGGQFTNIGGQSRFFLAALDPSTGNATAWDPNPNNPVESIDISGNTVYAAGYFTNIGGQARSFLAALDAITGNATVWNPNPNSNVFSVVEDGDEIYIGGNFFTVGGQSRSFIAALDVSSGNATSWNPGANGTIRSIQAMGGVVYIGGSFSNIGGQSRNRIAAVDAATGVTTSWNPNANNSVWSLSLGANTVYVGGDFTSIGGATRNRLAAINTFTGNATSWNPNLNDRVRAIASSGSAIFVGGEFDRKNFEHIGQFVGLTPSKLDQTITFNPLPNKTYGDADFALTGSSDSGLPLSYSSSNASVATITGSTVTIIGAGTTAITASQAGDDTFNRAAEVDQLLTVITADITVTADVQSKTYGENDPSLTYQITSGALVGGDSFSGGLSRDAGEDAVVYSINQNTLTAGSNYTITYEAAEFTINPADITVSADIQSKVYGESDPTLTYQVTSGALVGGDAFTGELSRIAGEDVGSYTIQQSTLTAGANYSLTYEEADLTISTSALTVTADALSKTYGEDDPTLTYQLTSGALVGTDAFTGELSRNIGENVGAYAINQNTLTAGSNYAITYETADFTIDKAALTVTADALSKSYGDIDPSLTYQLTSGTLLGDDSFSGELSREAGEDVGTYAITQNTLTAGSNYAIAFEPADLTINAAGLTVTADAQSKTYGDSDPSLTFQLSAGALLGDDTFMGELSREAGEDAGSYEINQNTLTAGANYTITYESADLVINKASLTYTAFDGQFNRGEVLPKLAYDVSGFIAGETEEAVVDEVPMISTTAISNSSRGAYPISFSGGADDNYDFIFIDGEMKVTGPVYDLPSSLDFEDQLVGESQTIQLNLVNYGDGAWDISDFSSTAEVYAVDLSTVQIEEGASAVLNLTFTPTEGLLYEGELVISSNNGEDRIALTGEGLVVSAISDEQLVGKVIIAYPNPVANNLNIDLSNAPVDNYDISLVNGSGVTVKTISGYSQATLALDISKFEQGFYLVHIASEQGRATRRVLIQR